MATYTSNYGWTKPSGSDNVDISVLNDNLDDQDSTIHDAFLNMAPPFSESSTYAVDNIVLYGTGLYKCHTAVVTPGSWTGSTNWQVYKLSEGGSGGGGGTSDYPDLTNKPSINGEELLGNKTASQLGMANSNTFQGTIAEWNQLTTAEKKAYDHASIPDSLDGNVTFPASKVMMNDGASVEADLASAVPRTATGTTLATLNTALQALSEVQKSRATVCVNNIYWMRRGLSAVFATSTYIGSSSIYQMQLQTGSTPHFYNISHNYGTTTHTSTETAVTSWTLYYQGTPIS